jgi:hypothetical protein
MKSFKSMAIISLYVLVVVAMLLFLCGYDKSISSIEKDGKLIGFSTVKDKGVTIKVADIITNDGQKFKVGYSCINGTRDIGANLSIIITERITTVAFIEFKKDTATALSSDICIRYNM